MTDKDLLVPRYLVLIDYPLSPYKVGDIIRLDSISLGKPYAVYPPIHWEQEEIEKFPYVFRKLDWHESILYSELPKYVMIDSEQYIGPYCIDEWHFRNEHDVFNSYFLIGAKNEIIGLSQVTPITEEQYMNYKRKTGEQNEKI